MSSKAHFNPKSLKWIISLVVMIVLSAGVIFATISADNLANKKYREIYDLSYNVASSESVALVSASAGEYGITAVEKQLDASGNVIGFLVSGTTVGYNAEVPIEMTATITADGQYVVGVDILKQEETEYLGVRIQGDDFKNQFKGRLLPVVSSVGNDKGSNIDVLAKSTISSEAVINGVSNAVEYLKETNLITPVEE